MCWIRYSSATINSEIRRTCSGQYNLYLKHKEADMLPRAVKSLGGHPDIRAESANRKMWRLFWPKWGTEWNMFTNYEFLLFCCLFIPLLWPSKSKDVQFYQQSRWGQQKLQTLGLWKGFLYRKEINYYRVLPPGRLPGKCQWVLQTFCFVWFNFSL